MAKKASSIKHTIAIISIAFAVSLLILVVAGLGVYARYLNKYQNTFYPGVHVAGFDLSGMTYIDAIDALEEPAALLQIEGVSIEFTGDVSAIEEAQPSISLPSVLPPADASSNELELFDVDFQRALNAAYGVGRDAAFITNIKDQVAARLYGREMPIDYRFERERIVDALNDHFAVFEDPAVNATLFINTSGEPETVHESIGSAFDIDAIVDELEQRIRSLDTTPLRISLQPDYPTISVEDIQSNIDQVNGYLDVAPITLSWEEEEEEWEMDRSRVGEWLSFEDGVLTVSPEQLEESITDIGDEVIVEATEARWKIEKDAGGAAIGFTPLTEAIEGRTINYVQTASDIAIWLNDNYRDKASGPDQAVPLTIVTEPSKHTPENIGELGIKDLLGTGHSNMSGSPVNRRGNIDRGIELLNGVLIAPEEEFSLVTTLKPFTLDNGYVAELVIKGNETVPEIGGGLCQIGTTTFRGAMGAGLDIIERRNHSYAVSYYSDDRNGLPGTDATIYDASPDLVFVNDTPGYILLQTRRDGNDLYFDYWGQSDGRQASFSEPVVSNWVSPPPLKEVETDTLAPGQRKCTESAHRGVTADFTYTVDYADGTAHEENFHSVYKPWQAVCLVGVDPNAANEQEVAPEPDPIVEDPVDDSEPDTTKNEKKKKT